MYSGTAIGFNWILLFEAYKYTSIALSTLSYYFAPVIIVILSSVIFKEKLNIKQGICFLGATTGLVFIIGVSGGGSDDGKGILFGLAAAVFYATFVLINKSIKGINGMKRTFFQFTAAVVVLLPYVGMKSGFHLLTLNLTGMINLLIVGVFHTGIMYFFYFSTLPLLKGQQAAILSYLDPLVAVLSSVLLLSEPIMISQLIGGGAILIFTLINETSIFMLIKDKK